jgi:hypothetical protein
MKTLAKGEGFHEDNIFNTVNPSGGFCGFLFFLQFQLSRDEFAVL